MLYRAWRLQTEIITACGGKTIVSACFLLFFAVLLECVITTNCIESVQEKNPTDCISEVCFLCLQHTNKESEQMALVLMTYCYL